MKNYYIIEEDLDYIISSKLPFEKFRNKSVLVTGASGMLPSYMIETFLYLNEKKDYNITIYALVRNKEKALKRFFKYLKSKKLIFIVQDVCDKIDLKEKMDFIIHAASNASPSYYGVDPVGTYKANVLGTNNLLELAKMHNSESFLYFSSGEVYGLFKDNKNSIKENDYGYLDPLKIRNCYAESKKMGENMCACYKHQYNLPVKIVRPAHTYGPGIDFNDVRVFSEFIKNIVNKENIVLKSLGNDERCFCYLADATIGFFTVMLNGLNGEAYNVSNVSCLISIKKLANKLVELFPEMKLKVIYSLKERKEGYIKSEVNTFCPNIEKITNLGWTPKYSIEEGFKRTVEVYL